MTSLRMDTELDARIDSFDLVKWAHAGELGRGYVVSKLLVLRGSRTRGGSHEGSDRDFAYLADEQSDGDPDALALCDDVCGKLKIEPFDLTKLNRAGGPLRYRVAKEGKLVWRRCEGVFARFTIEVTRRTFHVGSSFEASHAAVL